MAFKVKDHFYHKAKQEHFLARSVYKLQEIDQRFHLIRRGDRVLDFGYYPGSWIQYAAPVVGPEGLVVGVDLQPVNESLALLPHVRLLQRDATELVVLGDIGESQRFQGVFSDMAPKTTGIKMVDQARSAALVEPVCYKLPVFLQEGGYLVVKLFESEEAHALAARVKRDFNSMHRVRPQSTRSVSKEFFVIGKGFCI